MKGCPQVLRSDCGTENVLVAGMQAYFRAIGNDEVQDLTSMDHHLLTSELKVGGHSSEGVTLGGG